MDSSYEDEMEFEALFKASSASAYIDLQPGDEIVGTVVHIGSGGVQLDIDGTEGLLDVSQLDPDEMPAVGDEVRAFVLRRSGRLVEVGTRLNRTGQSKVALQTALDSGMPISGKIAETNKGGYVVEIGSARGFCPHAQIDIMRIQDPEKLVGSTMMFKVIELREGRDPIVSRRAVLEAERRLQADETRKLLVVGARFRGRVTSIRDFGFFVDIGGLEGLVHVSELPYGKKRPQEVVTQGAAIEVEVVRIEPAQNDRAMRVGLSMKALAEDPFEAAAAELGAGTIMRGIVTRVQPYGAFIEIATGVEGLLHVSAFGRRITAVRNVVSPGDDVIVRVKDVDVALRRMSLAWVEQEDLERTLDPGRPVVGNSLNARVLGHAMATEHSDSRGEAGGAVKAERRPPPPVDSMIDVTVTKHMRFGLLVSWHPSLGGPAEGLIPMQELNVTVSTELRKKYPVGLQFKAVVTDIRDDGRVRLSKKAAADHKERTEAAAYLANQQAQQKATKSEIGSFGELLKAKLGL